MLILGLDTATSTSTVALLEVGEQGSTVLARRSHTDPRRHGQVLPVQVDAVLADAGVRPGELGCVGVGTGPGAFTGLRVGLATADVLGLALGVPVHGVCTHDTLAWAAGRRASFAVVTDARRREVFWTRYADAATRVGDPVVGSAEAAAKALTGMAVVAPPGTPFLDRFDDVVEGQEPSAVALCEVVAHRIAVGAPQDLPHPRYLRRPDVSPPAAAKSVIP